MTLRLQGYTFKLAHIPSQSNICDYASQHPLLPPQPHSTENYVHFIAEASCPNTISISDIKTATLQDEILQIVATLSRTNSWYKLDKPQCDPNIRKHLKLLTT